MAPPDLERMYECGDVLANAKGLSVKAVSLQRHFSIVPSMKLPIFIKDLQST